MKLIVSLMLVLGLTGCMYQEADNVDVRKAEYFCGGVQNIDNITIGAVTSDVVRCTDGSKSFIRNIKIPKGEVK